MSTSLSINDKKRSALAAALLVVLAFACFFPSLFVGFISDDGEQYTYIYNYLHTQPLNLLRNFTNCWLEDPLWGLHYRPMMLVPLVFDTLVWNQNTVGWHLTCLTIHATCTVLVFFLALRFLRTLGKIDSMVIPFFAAALFAAHPLHAESVTWIAGRVDSVCTLFYLFSFLFFLKSFDGDKDRLFRIISIALSAAALLTKEVGASLPWVFAWFVFCTTYRNPQPFFKAVVEALKATRVYWAIYIVYLLVRSLVLGTAYGGYKGFASVATDAVWLDGLLNWRFLQGVYFPVSLPQIDELSYAINALICVHVAIALTVILRFALVRDWGIARAFVFLLGWIIAALVLVARVWYVTGNLPGGRHFYLISVPFCILSVLLLIPTIAKTSAQKKLKKLAVGLIAIYTLILGALTLKAHEVWLDEAQYETALQSRIAAFAAEHPDAARIVFLNAPRTYRRLVLYPSFANLEGCFKPPLYPPDVSKRIASNRSHFFDLDLVNRSDLASLLEEFPKTRVFGWDGDNKQLVPLEPQSAEGRSFDIAGAYRKNVQFKLESKNRDVANYLFVPDKSFDKNSVDCVEVSAICKPGSVSEANPSLLLSWNRNPQSLNQGVLTMFKTGDGARSMSRIDSTDGMASSLSCSVEPDGKLHTYRFHLSELASWILFGSQSNLQLIALPGDIEVKSVSFLNLSNEIPKLSAPPRQWYREQCGPLVPKDKTAIVLNFDASGLEGAKFVMAEISRPYDYFEFRQHTFRQDIMSNRSLKKYSLEGLKGEMTLWPEDFKDAGEYQVRVGAFDKDGRLIGYLSDPVTIRL